MMKFFYTGIRVRDLERSITFYRKIMGMNVARKGKMSHGGLWVEMKSPASYQRLELNWYPEDNMFYRDYHLGEELDHLCFRVSNVKETFQELVSKGVKPEVEPFEEGRYEFAFLSDPDGIWLELLGRTKTKAARVKKSTG